MKTREPLLLIAACFLVAGAAAAQPEQSHNLSEIHPMDVDLNLSSQDIFNVSELRLKNGLQFEDNAIQNSANMNLLRWDDADSYLEFGRDVNMSGNVLRVDKITNSAGGKEELVLAGAGNKNHVQLQGKGRAHVIQTRNSDIALFRDSNDGTEIMRVKNGGGVSILKGRLLMNNNTVSDVGPAQDPFDAVNKSYVDQTDDVAADDQTLSDVLALGNGAGTNGIDMEGNNITDSTGNVSIGNSLKVYGKVWSTGADLAEIYSSPQNLERGELVAINTGKDNSVVRTSRSYQETVTGVVSTNPSHVMNAFKSGYPIALEGKVEVRVTESSGEIERGDRVVPSGSPGVAMKCETWNPAEKEEKALRKIVAHNERCRSSTVGRALEKSGGKDKILLKLS